MIPDINATTTTEETPLKPKDQEKPTKVHYLALSMVGLAKLGDSVETYLPSVITQPMSCDLNLSKKEEDILALSMFASAGVFSVIAILYLRKLSRRPIILASLYISIIATIACSLVPNYTFLLLSRIAVGMAISINMIPLSVYLAEISPNKSFYVLSIAFSSLGWTLGGGWCGFLGYLFLGHVGWRWFVLITSIPLFIPPVLAFQIILPESRTMGSERSAKGDTIEGPEGDTVEGAQGDTVEGAQGDTIEEVQTSMSEMLWRTIIVLLFNVARSIPYAGAILLLPAIMKEDNIRNERGSPCNAIFGIQFLSVTLLFGVSHLLGHIFGYLVHANLSSAIIFTMYSLVSIFSTGLMMIYDDNIALLLTALSFIQVGFALAATEINILTDDKFFFTGSFLPVSSGIRLAVVFIMAIFANLISQLLHYRVVIKSILEHHWYAVFIACCSSYAVRLKRVGQSMLL